MAYLYIDDALVNALRPAFENIFDKEAREAGRKPLSPTDVVTRALQWAYGVKVKKRGPSP